MATQKSSFPVPELKKGEHYAGIILVAGKLTHHVILLAGEKDGLTWDEAEQWAKGKKGELPTRREQALLFANQPGQFKPEYYWSSETHAAYADYAWYQRFDLGSQGTWHKSDKLRARAVRRIVI